MIRIRRIAAHNFKQLRSVDLALPERGRILVQGPNEAGKSTLFEAVFFGLFGKALVSETAAGRLDDLIHYEAAEGRVELDLALADGRELLISRTLRRGKANVWELDIVRGAETLEEIRANRAVNERIEAELGFDAEALLNSCFVEQKKLDKLEGMSLAQREQSLMKLLNLDRLLAVGDRLRPRPADRAQVERLRERATLARLQTELPEAEAALAAAARACAEAEAHAALVALAASLEEREALGRALDAARAREAVLAERAAEAERLARALGDWEQGATALERADEAERGLRRLAVELGAARAARDQELPAVMARGMSLKRLERRLEWLVALEAEAGDLARRVAERDALLSGLATDREALNTLRRELVEARATDREAGDASAGLSQDLRAFEVREALSEWVAAAEARAALERSPGALEALRVERAAAARRLRRELLGLAGLSLALGLGIGALSARLPLALLVLALGLALLAYRAWSGGRRLAAQAQAIARLEGEAAVRERQDAHLAERVAAAERRLGDLNAVRPADPARGRSVLAELDRRLGDLGRAEVEQALWTQRERQARASAQVGLLEGREAALRAAIGRSDGAALGAERDAWETRRARLAAFLARARPRAEARAAGLGLALDAGAIAGEIGALREAVGKLRLQAGAAAGLEARRAELAAESERHRSEAAARWAALPEGPRQLAVVADDGRAPGLLADVQVPMVAELGRPGDPDDAPAAPPDSEAWAAAGEALRAAFEASGGDAPRRELAAATRAAAEFAGRVGALDQSIAARFDGLAGMLPGLGPKARSMAAGLAAAAEAEPAAARAFVANARTALALPPGATLAGLAEARDEARGRVELLRHEIARLAAALQLQGELLDPAQTEAEWRAAAKDLALRERAAAIVDLAGRNVVKRVLPSTLLHMRRLLPILTRGRYCDVQLTEDYRIEVYDDRAGSWKQKTIFSGGARDQMSLALRLAFALATLPEERGAAPSFLFLDEPLGAFDDERAQALIELLTEGEVAESFDQIFLISHVRVAWAPFDYHLRLAEGRVAESDLAPDPA